MSENLENKNENIIIYCHLCGEVINSEEGKCKNDHAFKKMCVNCASSHFNGTVYFCDNEKNMADAQKKLQDAIENSGVEKTHKVTVSIEPLPLKKPTAKCKEWNLDNDIKEALETLFV